MSSSASFRRHKRWSDDDEEEQVQNGVLPFLVSGVTVPWLSAPSAINFTAPVDLTSPVRPHGRMHDIEDALSSSGIKPDQHSEIELLSAYSDYEDHADEDASLAAMLLDLQQMSDESLERLRVETRRKIDAYWKQTDPIAKADDEYKQQLQIISDIDLEKLRRTWNLLADWMTTPLPGLKFDWFESSPPVLSDDDKKALREERARIVAPATLPSLVEVALFVAFDETTAVAITHMVFSVVKMTQEMVIYTPGTNKAYEMAVSKIPEAERAHYGVKVGLFLATQCHIGDDFKYLTRSGAAYASVFAGALATVSNVLVATSSYAIAYKAAMTIVSLPLPLTWAVAGVNLIGGGIPLYLVGASASIIIVTYWVDSLVLDALTEFAKPVQSAFDQLTVELTQQEAQGLLLTTLQSIPILQIDCSAPPPQASAPLVLPSSIVTEQVEQDHLDFVRWVLHHPRERNPVTRWMHKIADASYPAAEIGIIAPVQVELFVASVTVDTVKGIKTIVDNGGDFDAIYAEVSKGAAKMIQAGLSAGFWFQSCVAMCMACVSIYCTVKLAMFVKEHGKYPSDKVIATWTWTRNMIPIGVTWIGLVPALFKRLGSIEIQQGHEGHRTAYFNKVIRHSAAFRELESQDPMFKVEAASIDSLYNAKSLDDAAVDAVHRSKMSITASQLLAATDAQLDVVVNQLTASAIRKLAEEWGVPLPPVKSSKAELLETLIDKLRAKQPVLTAGSSSVAAPTPSNYGGVYPKLPNDDWKQTSDPSNPYEFFVDGRWVTSTEMVFLSGQKRNQFARSMSVDRMKELAGALELQYMEKENREYNFKLIIGQIIDSLPRDRDPKAPLSASEAALTPMPDLSRLRVAAARVSSQSSPAPDLRKPAPVAAPVRPLIVAANGVEESVSAAEMQKMRVLLDDYQRKSTTAQLSAGKTIEHLSSDNERLRSAYDAQRVATARMVGELNQFKIEVNRLQGENSKCLEEIGVLKLQRGPPPANVEQFRKQMNQVSQEKLKEQREEIVSLKSLLTAAQNELSLSTEVVKSLEHNVERLTYIIAQRDEDLAGALDEVSHLESEVEQLKSEINDKPLAAAFAPGRSHKPVYLYTGKSKPSAF